MRASFLLIGLCLLAIVSESFAKKHKKDEEKEREKDEDSDDDDDGKMMTGGDKMTTMMPGSGVTGTLMPGDKEDAMDSPAEGDGEEEEEKPKKKKKKGKKKTGMGKKKGKKGKKAPPTKQETNEEEEERWSELAGQLGRKSCRNDQEIETCLGACEADNDCQKTSIDQECENDCQKMCIFLEENNSNKCVLHLLAKIRFIRDFPNGFHPDAPQPASKPRTLVAGTPPPPAFRSLL